jgi:hypothetical protein
MEASILRSRTQERAASAGHTDPSITRALRTSRAFPLDVALGASVLSIPFLLGFGFLTIALRGERDGDVPLGLFYAALFLIPSVLRSISLARTWKARRRVGNHVHEQD